MDAARSPQSLTALKEILRKESIGSETGIDMAQNFRLSKEANNKFDALNLANKKTMNMEGNDGIGWSMPAVRDLPDYSSVEYWNKRYLNERELSFEWLQPYEAIREIILEKLNNNFQAEILVLGCGNSLVSEKLYDDGYKYITNVDFSEVIINELLKRYEDKEEMDFQVMDARSLDIEDEGLDLILDKGTFDSLVCSSNNFQDIMLMIKNIYRVLSPGGVYICISHGKPETRCSFFQNPQFQWKLEIQTLSKIPMPEYEKIESSQTHYAYILTKKND